MSTPPKRRIVLIDRPFQVRQIVAFIAVQAAVLALFGSCLYMFLNSEVEANLASAHAAYRTLASMLFPIILTLSLLDVIVSALLVAIFVLYQSHRIAGPLFRFHAALTEMSQGNLRPMTRIRRLDQLVEISDAMTRLSDTLAENFEALQQKARDVQEAVPADSPAADRVKEMQAILARWKP